MPNSLAYLMLMIWPAVCVVLFLRLPLERAIVWSILGGYLVLPQRTEFDLPLVPAMDKYSIPSISAFAICVLLMRRKVPLWPQSVTGRVLTLMFVLGAIPTVLTNGDAMVFTSIQSSEPIVFINDRLPGLGLRDLFSVLSQQMIVLLPFLIARQYLSSDTGLREVLLALVVGGLVYSVPSLVEIRLSPQINVWVYGFFQHDFEQMMRGGGFRPIVFLRHGLWLAFFMMTAMLAAGAMARTLEGSARVRFGLAMIYLFAVLYLCKSLASLVYGIAFAPVVLLAGPRLQVRLAIMVAIVAVIYPMLRNGGLIPTEAILEQARLINPERAESLAFRLNNEELLLERAAEKPWFGWGGWGRNLVHDLETGEILTIPDGRWIIAFGAFGWVGYLAEMGLLALPLLLVGHRIFRLNEREISPYVAPIAIILAANMIDMLLNATLVPYTWLCAGAVLGYGECLYRDGRAPGAREPLRDGPVIGGRRVRNGRRTIL
ncbi:MAG: hypothetical protein ACK5MY_01665 [Jhaorihella sp.]